MLEQGFSKCGRVSLPWMNVTSAMPPLSNQKRKQLKLYILLHILADWLQVSHFWKTSEFLDTKHILLYHCSLNHCPIIMKKSFLFMLSAINWFSLFPYYYFAHLCVSGNSESASSMCTQLMLGWDWMEKKSLSQTLSTTCCFTSEVVAEVQYWMVLSDDGITSSLAAAASLLLLNAFLQQNGGVMFHLL